MTQDYSNPFAAILELQEDRGVKAVINALKEMRVMSYDYENQCYSFSPMKVSTEALDIYIKRALKES